jgi:hypothetical protein
VKSGFGVSQNLSLLLFDTVTFHRKVMSLKNGFGVSQNPSLFLVVFASALFR